MQPRITVLRLDDKHQVKHASLRNAKNIKERANNPQEVRDQLITKKLFMSKQEPLPQIQSPFLKKTVNNLFPFSSCHFSPNKLQNKNIHFQKYSTSIHPQEHKYEVKANKIFNNIEFGDETNNHANVQAKIKKSLSQVKRHHKLTPQKSLPAGSPSLKHSKVPTQQSVSSNYSKQFYQKLTHFESMQQFLPEKLAQKPALERAHGKLFRHSTFVMQHKLAQQLYSQEREEIRMVQNIFASRHCDNVGKSIKIKNYTKFLPNFINIQT